MNTITNAIYVTSNGMRGMLEYFSVDVKERTILMFRGYDSNLGVCVRNLYTVEEAKEIFGNQVWRLA